MLVARQPKKEFLRLGMCDVICNSTTKYRRDLSQLLPESLIAQKPESFDPEVSASDPALGHLYAAYTVRSPQIDLAGCDLSDALSRAKSSSLVVTLLEVLE